MVTSEVPFGLEVLAEGTRLVIKVHGEIDAWTAPEVAVALTAAGVSQEREIDVDLEDVVFIDSTGILALLQARDELMAHGHVLMLRSPSDRVQRVLALTGLARHFEGDAAADR